MFASKEGTTYYLLTKFASGQSLGRGEGRPPCGLALPSHVYCNQNRVASSVVAFFQFNEVVRFGCR